MTVTMPRPRADLAEYAEKNGLKQLGGRPPLFAYIKELFVRRHFALELAKSKIRSQNEQDRLGLAWVVLTPLLNAAVYGFIFGILLQSKSSRPQPLMPYLICGVFTFAFFSGCFSDGAKSIIGNRGLVRTLHFPRAVLPIATVLQKMLELCAQVIVMVIIVMLAGEAPAWRWLLLFPVFMVMSLFCAGIAFFAARLTIHVSDVAQLIPFITRLIFYVSGIFFSIERRFGTRPNVEAVLKFNPMNVYITLVRDCLIGRSVEIQKGVEIVDIRGIGADLSTIWIGVAWAVVMFIGGFIFFWRAEGLYGRE